MRFLVYWQRSVSQLGKIEQRVVFDGSSRMAITWPRKIKPLPYFANGLLPMSGDAAYPEAE